MTATFIVGLPRSGTTLLATMLNAHSELCVPPETHYFSEPRWAWLRARAPRDAQACLRFMDRLLNSPAFRAFGFNVEERTQIIGEACAGPIGHGRILHTVLGTYASRAGKTRWVEKTPRHLEARDRIRAALPEARFLHLVRDPRDVLLSLRRVPWNRRTAGGHYRRWRRAARAFDSDPCCLELRYEDLLGRPRRTLATTLDFLGLPWEEAVLQPGAVARQSNFDVAAEPWKARSLQAIDPANARKWHAAMADWEKWWADQCLGDALARHGYAPSGVPFRPGHAMRAAAAEALWPVVFSRFLHVYLTRR